MVLDPNANPNNEWYKGTAGVAYESSVHVKPQLSSTTSVRRNRMPSHKAVSASSENMALPDQLGLPTSAPSGTASAARASHVSGSRWLPESPGSGRFTATGNWSP